MVFFRGEQFIIKLSEAYFIFCYFVSERRREREAQKEASMEEMKVSALRTTWGLSIFKCKGSEKIKSLTCYGNSNWGIFYLRRSCRQQYMTTFVCNYNNSICLNLHDWYNYILMKIKYSGWSPKITYRYLVGWPPFISWKYPHSFLLTCECNQVQ